MVKVWRNDDISPNSDLWHTKEVYRLLRIASPAPIWSCINIFSSRNGMGSVYSRVPFKHQPVKWFYNVDSIMNLDWVDEYREISEVVSHGLFHINHAKVSKDVQEMSILSSCHLLKTKIFVPPFNAYNSDTVDICKDSGIRLVQVDEDWKSIEYENFDNSHENWYLHSWRWTPEALREKLCRQQEV